MTSFPYVVWRAVPARPVQGNLLALDDREVDA